MPTIPTDADPAVRFVLEQVPHYKAQYALEVQAGLGTDTVRRWFYDLGNPKIKNVRRALKALGYRLEIVKDT